MYLQVAYHNLLTKRALASQQNTLVVIKDSCDMICGTSLKVLSVHSNFMNIFKNFSY